MNQIVEHKEGELPITHSFSNGVYAREIFMPKGMIVVGHMHKTRHLNIVSTGSAKVWINNEFHYIKAPITFESNENTRKVLYIEEDMFWTTIHPTNETDLEQLTENLIDLKASEGLDILSICNNVVKEIE